MTVGISHDVDENKGTYFRYPTISLKTNDLFRRSWSWRPDAATWVTAKKHFVERPGRVDRAMTLKKNGQCPEARQSGVRP